MIFFSLKKLETTFFYSTVLFFGLISMNYGMFKSTRFFFLLLFSSFETTIELMIGCIFIPFLGLVSIGEI